MAKSVVAQPVSDAISRSISHDEIVTIDLTSTEREYRREVAALLLAACEGHAKGERHEYWGTHEGHEWRVHTSGSETGLSDDEIFAAVYGPNADAKSVLGDIAGMTVPDAVWQDVATAIAAGIDCDEQTARRVCTQILMGADD